jgi:transcriptional regulator with XRE-family HTH domain
MKPAQRILLQCKRLGWTQVELAQFLGVHPMTISKWERGKPIKPGLYQQRLQAWLNR